MFNAHHLAKSHLPVAIRSVLRAYRVRRTIRDEPIISHESLQAIHLLVGQILSRHPDAQLLASMPRTFERCTITTQGHVLLLGCPSTWGYFLLHLVPEGEFAREIVALRQFLEQEYEGRRREVEEMYDGCKLPRAA